MPKLGRGSLLCGVWALRHVFGVLSHWPEWTEMLLWPEWPCAFNMPSMKSWISKSWFCYNIDKDDDVLLGTKDIRSAFGRSRFARHPGVGRVFKVAFEVVVRRTSELFALWPEWLLFLIGRRICVR
ncbi:hypothetical protein Nepgr_031672 [Nepenthes gracilis]|uniref:Secreted protein n=1 Tax=Nepenthes gracilis TaxID=150966 RepID=A0AAD3TIL0_NEPGR|nr:hypothetical protein Nepgr_031672 [Nepenthes gracilis]